MRDLEQIWGSGSAEPQPQTQEIRAIVTSRGTGATSYRRLISGVQLGRGKRRREA